MEAKDDHNYETSMILPLRLYYLSGYRFDYPSRALSFCEFWKFYWRFIALNLTCYIPDVVYCEGLWLYRECQKGDMNFQRLSFLLPCIVYGYQAVFKIFILFFKRYDLMKIHKKIGDLYMQIDSKENKDMINARLGRLSYMMKPAVTACYANIAFFAITPSIGMLYKFYVTKNFEILSVFPMAYPFDEKKWYIFPFLFVRQVWDGAVALFSTVGSDCFFACVITHLALNLEILSRDIKTSVLDCSNVKKSEIPLYEDYDPSRNLEDVVVDQKRLRDKLTTYIKKHIQILELIEMVDSVHSVAVFTTYIFSAINICLTGFNILFLPAINVAQFITFMSVCVIQIFIVCYIGNIISTAGVGVAEAVCNSHWYLADSSNKRTFAILLMRSQKPINLNASVFVTLNLETFSKVMSSSASYLTLLRTFMDVDSMG